MENKNRDLSDKPRNCNDTKNQRSRHPTVILKNNCLEKFCNIYRKTSVTMSFANEVKGGKTEKKKRCIASAFL